MSERNLAIDHLDRLSQQLSAQEMLDYIIIKYLTGDQALEVMLAVEEEFLGDIEDIEV